MIFIVPPQRSSGPKHSWSGTWLSHSVAGRRSGPTACAPPEAVCSTTEERLALLSQRQPHPGQVLWVATLSLERPPVMAKVQDVKSGWHPPECLPWEGPGSLGPPAAPNHPVALGPQISLHSCCSHLPTPLFPTFPTLPCPSSGGHPNSHIQTQGTEDLSHQQCPCLQTSAGL